jgi:hypothetical protein
MRFTLIKSQLCHCRWTSGAKGGAAMTTMCTGLSVMLPAMPSANLSPSALSALRSTTKTSHIFETLFLNYMFIFACIEYAANLPRIHNLNASPATVLLFQPNAGIPCPTICLIPAKPNAQRHAIIQTPRNPPEILYKRYAISQIDCLFHCLMPISFTNLLILISSASPSLSAYLSDRPLVSTRMYSIS